MESQFPKEKKFFVLLLLAVGIITVYPQRLFPQIESKSEDSNYIEGIQQGKIDEATDCINFENSDGTVKRITGVLGKIRSYMPEGAELGVAFKRGDKKNYLEKIPVYLGDFSQDGKTEILLMAPDKNTGQKMLLALDVNGELIDKRPFDSIWPEEMTFGLIKKGTPLCFGLNWCALSAGVCNWEFYVLYNGKIKPVLVYNGWDGKSGPFTPPVFKNVEGDEFNEVLTDNGNFKWDDNNKYFLTIKSGNHIGDRPVTFTKSYTWYDPRKGTLEHLENGKKYYHQHNYGMAIQEYIFATNDDYENYEAWGLMGYAYLKQRGPNYAYEALGPLSKSIKIKPDYLMGHYNLALVFWALNDPKDTIQEIDKVVQLDPNYKKIIQNDPQFGDILDSDAYKTWEAQQAKHN